MSSKKPVVGVLMGSDSDFDVMKGTFDIFKEFEVPFEVMVSSAHRTPKRTAEYAKTAKDRGIKAIIVGAGAAAHLAGVIASETTIPVIGVPINATSLNGLDALYATVQMPGGIPVASMSIGKSGAKNAALFVCQILALNDEKLAKKHIEYRKKMVKTVTEKSERLKKKVEEFLNE
jgi:phosphoribosylaminoimidazole carboxylase PurE protein